MDQELERVLRGLDEAAEFAKTYRFELAPLRRALATRAVRYLLIGVSRANFYAPRAARGS